MMMTLGILEKELAGLKFLHGVETTREVYEGKFHSGDASVVQVIGKYFLNKN